MKQTRPFTAEELATLDDMIGKARKQINWAVKSIIIALLAVVLFAKIGFAMPHVFGKSNVVIAVVIFLGLIAFLPGSTLREYRKKLKNRLYIKQKNVATSIRVTPTRCCMLEEKEDEGVYYLFEIGNGKVISLGGQDFYPDEKFPSDDFEIVEARDAANNIAFGETHNKGKKIEPFLTIGRKQKGALFKHARYPDPYHFTVVDGTIEDVLAACGKKETLPAEAE